MHFMFSTRNFIFLITTLFLFLLSNNSMAAAFQLFEGNAVNTGNFAAGDAAIAGDASTTFYNPAGLVHLDHPQIVISGVGIFTDVQYRGSATWRSTAIPEFAFTQTGSAQGGGAGFVPSVHFAFPINHHYAFGFSIIAPFGLSTEYPIQSIVRYAATSSKLNCIDLTPSFALKFAQYIGLGAGFDVEYLKINFDSVAGLPTTPGNPALFDTTSDNDLSDIGYGYHVGFMIYVTPHTRVGATYHSKIRFNLHGRSKLRGPLAANTGEIVSNNLTAKINMPASLDVGFYHDFNYHWAIMGSFVYTWWNTIQNLVLRNAASVTATLAPVRNLTVIAPTRYRNTWRVALGGHYRINQHWLVRAGTGFDLTPTVNSARDVRLPDGNRFALAIGGEYDISKRFSVDVGWTHLFVKDGKINSTAVAGNQLATLNGRTRNSGDFVGAQLNWNLV